MAGENEDNNLQSFSPKNESSTASSSVNLDTLRKKVRKYIDMHLHKAAIFWADKVASLSNEDAYDIYWLAQSLYCSGQYHRAAITIKSRNLHKTDLECRYLAAKCHFAGKEYKEALDVLSISEISALSPLNWSSQNVNSETDDQNIVSAILLLKGQIYEAMDNRGLAAECFQDALQHDVYCYDAFDSLVQHQMLNKEEELNLMKSLPFETQCPEDEPNIVKFLYETQLKKYDKPGDLVIPPEIASLSGNLDVGNALAERCFYNCDYEQCFKITSSILNKDPFHLNCLPIHISCLMQLDKSNALFYLAHKLVDLYPESAIAWYAVGCYYLLITKTDAARRYLSKATALDRIFGPAWIMYGHSFAVENEHDQAMAAYCRASQLMKGCHLPLLYIGLEYGLSNNNKLAERFFAQAQTIAPEDPFVLHELGVVAYQNQDYDTALSYFNDSLRKINCAEQTVMPEKWERLLNNLGHVCRKLKKFDEALEYHERALILKPQNPSTFAAIGFIHSLTGKWAEAVEYFHKALGLQRDDVFSNTMLTSVIEQLVKESSPCVETPEELPDYPFPTEVPSNTCNRSDETSDIMTEIITDDIQSLNDHTQNTNSSMDIEMETIE
ncbi:cell division cycle protein 16 homolog [Uloborus diversus]|uniref:cell division cycle protein 16 homolog n=1 Tax=Uloborus diversus TaxID=327109 RepID=UPI0024099E97|nr:cell division cycle protein 16 homolog [Uloborus diversus]